MTERSNQIIEGVLALPASLSFASEVAGTVTLVKIGGVDFEVEVPGIEAGGSNPSQELAPPYVQSAKGNWGRYLHDPETWGYVAARHKDGSVSKVTIERILLRTEFPEASDVKQLVVAIKSLSDALYGSIDRWSSLLIDWLEVGSGRVLHGNESAVQQQGKDLHVWGHDGTSYVTLARSQPITILRRTSDGLSLNTWQRALRLASSNDAPPTEYLLIRDARWNMLNGDFRRSVLDAATGAEMALAKLLDAKLASAPPIAAQLVRDRWTQIGGLVRALKKFGVTLPSGIDGTGLATPRNHAIHRGTVPTKDEAVQSINIAEQVIEMALPLATVFSIAGVSTIGLFLRFSSGLCYRLLRSTNVA